ncbi:HAD family hydrolase [Malaciobacter mytili]|uniref:phosphoglycolate phosphatase n=1 Tax=Malaciobacter mytili LMG 24559 TaxID=1032238 RepID=A0AAX2ACF8_9BACT|nr:HAD family hydrolase [Malaciobacter mytili]AXH16252.1 phosphoglycolate phosphatase [Malaciobacter mytili LMG 24559]RXI42382.1 HAD family hydrolase [Malaciobacter mytili]RXK13765.1 HAD family hydrolase [Malaciobacter mytili LMG 24559]
MKKTIIFDLDGTLIDSVLDIALCMNEVLKEFNLKTYEIEEYNYFLGGGVDILVNNVLKENSNINLKNSITKRFQEVYENTLHSNTKPYEGIYELLDELIKMQFNIAVLSNKPHKFTLGYVEKLFGKYNLKEVHGQKTTIEKKPHPQAAINIANSFNTPCEKTYFVGDTKVDMQTATNAGMISIGVLWGFRDEDELKKYNANYIVEKPLDIIEILKKNHEK